MSDPQTSRPEFPIVPALVVSSLLGGLIAFGLSGLWRFAFPEPLNRPKTTANATTAEPLPNGSAAVIEFLPALTPQEQRFEEIFENPAECNFNDTPLVDVAAFFGESTKIKIVIDNEGLAEEGIAPDSAVTRKLSGVRLRTLLHLILTPLQLAAIPHQEVLLVTTRAKAKEYLVTRTYPVSDLCYLPDDKGLDLQSLTQTIEEETSGPWQVRDGEGGTCTELALSGSLSVRQTYHVHREILDLLRSLRAAQRCNLAIGGKDALKRWYEQRAAAVASQWKPSASQVEFSEVIGLTQNEAERQIEKALDKSVSLSFQNTPLTDVVTSLAKQLSVNVTLDSQALMDEGIPTDVPVTLQLERITARSALELLLKPPMLAAVIEHEALLITTASKEREKLITYTYPVSDLIGPNENYALLVQLLESSTSGPWMTRDGEGGVVTALDTTGSLVIRQTTGVQRQVLNLLRQQREAQQHMLPLKPGKPSPNRR